MKYAKKINRRFKLFKLPVASKCPSKWLEYKRLWNDVTRSMRQAKASYFSDLFSEVKNTNAYWNLITKATNPKTRKKHWTYKRRG